jgi:ferredoxin-NADP reductase
MIKDEIPDYLKTAFYLCGPPGMVEALRKLLGNMGIQGDQIKTENFQGY